MALNLFSLSVDASSFSDSPLLSSLLSDISDSRSTTIGAIFFRISTPSLSLSNTVAQRDPYNEKQQTQTIETGANYLQTNFNDTKKNPHKGNSFLLPTRNIIDTNRLYVLSKYYHSYIHKPFQIYLCHTITNKETEAITTLWII